jgi:hypothetical protein
MPREPDNHQRSNRAHGAWVHPFRLPTSTPSPIHPTMIMPPSSLPRVRLGPWWHAEPLLGLGGAVAGAVAGGALENTLNVGLPKDELYVYEDALRDGRIVLIVLANDTNQADEVREALARAGAESVDAAREHWWLGLRDAEAEAYTAQGFDFTKDEQLYRKGFEAALQPAAAGKSYADALDFLQTHYPEVYREEAFRRGYARGYLYRQGLREQLNS